MNLKVGIFGKGGAGKSTCTVLLARSLRARGHSVIVLDADSTNRGLNQALGIDKVPLPLVTLFGGTVFRGGAVSCPVDDPTPLSGRRIALDELPEGYCTKSPEGIVYLMAGKLGDDGPGAGCDGPLAKIARDLVVESHQDDQVVLVDSKAGFEDSARGLITGLDFVVVVVDPTTASVALAKDMIELVEAIRRGALPATEHLESEALVRYANDAYRNARIRDVLVILNRVQDPEGERLLLRRLSELGIPVLGAVPAQPEIGIAWLEGLPLPSVGEGDGITAVTGVLENAFRYAR
jgi:CO dehydrogenase nickel-insertion accessory protein CooC1